MHFHLPLPQSIFFCLSNSLYFLIFIQAHMSLQKPVHLSIIYQSVLPSCLLHFFLTPISHFLRFLLSFLKQILFPFVLISYSTLSLSFFPSLFALRLSLSLPSCLLFCLLLSLFLSLVDCRCCFSSHTPSLSPSLFSSLSSLSLKNKR